jgi:hypothetical protein
VAGIFEGTSESEPDEPLARSAARLCRMAGADTSVSLTTASLQRTAEAAWSIMSPPGDWRHGWRPDRNHPCSPGAWSGSWRPEPMMDF